MSTLDATEARLALASAARSWVAGPMPGFTCAEVDKLADALRFLDEPELAGALIERHAVEDEPGDEHYCEPETCEARGYKCCELTPPPADLVGQASGRYRRWYAAHVDDWEAAQRGELDTTSSASRQHYIETGRYLRRGEAIEA